MLKILMVLVFGMLAAPSFAADRETSAPLPLAPVTDAGRILVPYVGVHAGWSDWRVERPDDHSSPHQQMTGLGAGAQVGVDARLPAGVVLGVVADVTIGDLDSGTVRDGATITVDSDVTAFGTLRGKLGYDLGRVTPYLTGGAAWMSGSTSEHCPAGALGGHCKRAGAYDESESFSRWGWAYGAGAAVELAEHVELFGEWVRLDFGTTMHDLGPKSSDRQHALDEVDTVKIGVNYRF